MNLALPLGLAAAALAVPLTIWYVLKSRRPRQVVASTYLWRQTDHSVSAAIPWQRFRPDLTFWLILLAILIGALALARPYVTVSAQLGDHTIIIIDASASMLADEEGPTRLELARREITGLVDKLGPGQEMSFVEASSRARVLISSSSDPAALKDALASLRPTHGPADLVDAFTLAAALERPGQSTVVHLVTDRVVPPGAEPAMPEGLIVTAVGQDRPNLAVTRLQAVPVGAGSSQVFVQVRNFGPLGAKARLTLSIDAEDVVERALELGPRGTVDEVLTVRGGDGEVLVARVEPSGQDVAGNDLADALTVDDAAFAVLSAPRELTVMLVSPGNVFLGAALSAVPGVELQSSPVVPNDLVGVDLLVLDRVPAPDAPTLPTLYIAPTSLPAGITSAGEVELPALTFQSPGHELLADVDLSDVAVAAAEDIDAPALTTVAGGTAGPLILAGRLDGTPVVLLPFDLLQSNLPLQPAWPVLVANSLNWLAGPPVTLPATAGQTVTLPAPAGVTSLVVSPPSGDEVRLDVARPRLLVDQVGVWRVLYEGSPPAGVEPPVVAVNTAPDEGDLAAARPDFVEARDAAEAGQVAGAAEGRRVFGRELVAGVLALVALEWLWVHGVRPWLRRRRRPVPVGGAA